ncbi:CDP-alcohol phosphatidyltransferase family protein [Mycobacteroides abscessus]
MYVSSTLRSNITESGDLTRSEYLSLARLSVIPSFIIGIIADINYLTIIGLIIFVIGDTLDGIKARRYGQESMRRRVIDALVDRVGIHLAYAAYAVTTPIVPAVWIALVVKDLLQFPFAACAVSRGFVLVGSVTHKVVGIIAAAYGACLVLDINIPEGAAITAITLILWCTLTYICGSTKILRTEQSSTIIVVPTLTQLTSYPAQSKERVLDVG